MRDIVEPPEASLATFINHQDRLLALGREITSRSVLLSPSTSNPSNVLLEIIHEHTLDPIDDTETNLIALSLKQTRKTKSTAPKTLARVTAKTGADLENGHVWYTLFDRQELELALQTDQPMRFGLLEPKWFFDPLDKDSELTLIDPNQKIFHGTIAQTRAGELLLQEAVSLAESNHNATETVQRFQSSWFDHYLLLERRVRLKRQTDEVTSDKTTVEYLGPEAEFTATYQGAPPLTASKQACSIILRERGPSPPTLNYKSDELLPQLKPTKKLRKLKEKAAKPQHAQLKVPTEHSIGLVNQIMSRFPGLLIDA
jgi:hypothetical protein